jgi:glycerophosphoryl diester phosphodiesterase
MNLLSPGIIGKILAEVEDRTADEWLNAGSEFKTTQMDEKIPTLKEALKSFKEAHAPSPFAHRILAMISTASPSREGTLYKALSKSGNAGMVIEAAKKNFPSELVMDLPAPLLKEIIQSYPMIKRIDLLHSRPEDIRATLLDMVAETGSPGRDMLDMELENVGRDAAKSASIESRAEDIWQDFVKNTRITLSQNAAYTSITHALIKEWGQNLGAGLHAIKGGKAA